MVLDISYVSTLLSRYKLGKLQNVQFISDSDREESYLVNVKPRSLLSKTQSLLLKRYHDHDIAQLHLSNSITARIAGRGVVSVAKPLFTTQGQTVICDGNNSYSLFQVHDQIENHVSQRTNLTSQKLVSAGMTLAQFHNAVSDHPSHDTNTSRCFKYADIASLFTLEDEIETHTPRSETDTFLLSTLPRLHDHFASYLNRLKYVPFHSNLQLIHGRFTPQSLVFSGQDVVTLLDNEHVRFDHPGYELAEALMHFSRSDISHSHFDLARMRDFLSAYALSSQRVSLDAHEIVVFMKHSRLQEAADVINRFRDGSKEHDVAGEVSACLADLDAIDKQEPHIISSFDQAGLLE